MPSLIDMRKQFALRMGPLVLLDVLFNNGLSVWSWTDDDDNTSGIVWVILQLSRIYVYCLVCFTVTVVGLLRIQHLIIVYGHALSLLAAYLSFSVLQSLIKHSRMNDVLLEEFNIENDLNYILNNITCSANNIKNNADICHNPDVYTMNIAMSHSYIKFRSNLDSHNIYDVMLVHFIIQSALCYICYHFSVYKYLPEALMISFIATFVFIFVDTPYYVLKYLINFVFMIPYAIIIYQFFIYGPMLASSIIAGYRFFKNFIVGFGFAVLIEMEWHRIGLPFVFLGYFLIRLMVYAFIYQFYNVYPISEFETILQSSIYNLAKYPSLFDHDMPGWKHFFKSLLVTGCENYVALMGMTTIVAAIFDILGILFINILSYYGEEKNFGTVAAILFMILSIQTGITNLQPIERYNRTLKNLHLLNTAFLHILHSVVNNMLLRISASRSLIWNKHFRVLGVSFFILAYASGLMIYLWNNNTWSTWLFAVSAFCIEVTIKTVISIIIYGLYLYESFKDTTWDTFDDYLFYVRATGSIIEFSFGIFLFCNGCYILFVESGGILRGVMMMIHVYYNIWIEGRKGWSTMVKRKTASKKINMLADASDEQLDSFADVCAICYQDMTTAKITTCFHFFHSSCLKKWLYIEDNCPLCHKILFYKAISLEPGPNRAVLQNPQRILNGS